MAKVSVIGLGYVGLPTAIILSESGLDVYGCDIDQNKVDKINQGIKVIEEHEIDFRLTSAIERKNFIASTEVSTSDFYIIAVPTPINSEKKANLDYVWAACKEIAKKVKPGNCVIIESTVPVGTTKKVASFLEQESGLILGISLFVAFSPERVLPGKTFTELVHNERLIGGVDNQSSLIAKKLYQSFVKGNIELTNSDTAEMVKLVENSSRDVQIAFANQVDAMAASVQVDSQEVIKFANKHPRVSILKPGCGVGGHCIPVDPWFLIESFPGQTGLLSAAREVNDSRPKEVLSLIKHKVKELKKTKNLNKVRLFVFGITYKPDVDDLRNSPALEIAKKLENCSDIDLIVIDPMVEVSVLQKHFVNCANKLDHVVESTDLAVVLVSHNSFRAIQENLFVAKDVLDFTKSNLIPNKKNSLNI